MTATNHAVTGALVAIFINEPLLAVPVAFISHFVMDAIPHFDAGPDSPRLAKIVVFTDVLSASILSLVLALLLKSDISPWLVLACAFACMSPDLVWGWRFYKLKDISKILLEPMSIFSRLHQKIQWSETHLGALVEVVWFASVLSIIILKR
jgi:hypothetical protein